MIVWIDSLELVMKEIKEAEEAARQAKILAETPVRIRLFDEEGKEALTQMFYVEVNEL